MILKRFLVASAFLPLAACSFFGGDEVDLSEPAELLDFEPRLEVSRNWNLKIGDGSGEVYPVSYPELLDGVIYVGDRSGRVVSVDKETGDRIWSVDLDETITGSIGVGGNLVVLGTQKGQVYALSRESGEVVWIVQLSSKVLASPETDGNVVVTQTQDGKIYGLSAEDGSRIWLIDVNLPLLTVHAAAKPALVNGVAYVGLDNGKAAAYRMEDGIGLWEVRVGVPEGKNDLERMVDVDSPLLYHNGNIYATAYQSGVMAINPQAGRGLWYQEGSSKTSPGAYGGTLVVTQDDGMIKAYNASDGTLLWETDEFSFRDPNSPALTNDFVAFADFEGYLHLLTRRTGEVIGRQKVGDGVRSPTIIDGEDILVLSNSGVLSSYRVSEL